MSTSTAAIHNTNKACCTIPPVQSDYTPKGSFKPYGDFKKVYVTGSGSDKHALVCVFDIFGYFPQTQQGADILASTLNTTVYMPDFFEPNPPFPYSKYPPQTDQDKKDIQEFFGGTAKPSFAVEKLLAFGNNLKKQGITKVGVYGFCWGGKVVVTSASDVTPFSSAAIVHPAMLSVDDAKKLAIPLAIYISNDEPVDEYNGIVDVLAKKPFAANTDHKHYKNMFHGWAAARADLKNDENKKEYEDVYSKLADFFHKTLV
ncbi:dienelactone hydrolase [Crucibulum laeve]|uniref:Dienelactone hydrolase n=1 Tax=Crucibulum laeve TaxID=68775 RepID=A0A5C3LY17_9AGAR|nr:dienelactone hydrolase [Crucibulum laeve]